MAKHENKRDTSQPLNEGYQPYKKGYQPNKGNLNSANPPQGGSGVPSKDSSSVGDNKKPVDKK